jgi:iron complex transport system permease protein
MSEPAGTCSTSITESKMGRLLVLNKAFFIIPVTLVIAFVLIAAGVLIGAVRIEAQVVLRALFGRSLAGEEQAALIVRNLRLPRVIMALMVGMMLSTSGTVVQAVFRNPLADPYIIGISAGAVAGAVLSYSLGLSELWYGINGFIISLCTAILLFRFAATGDGISVSTLLIVGVAVSSFLGAITSFAMYAIGEDSYRIIIWTMGYLGGATWKRVLLAFFPMLFAIALFIFRRHELDALMCSDEEAYSLGINVAALKRELLAVSALIVAFSVAFCGMIGFVGLIVPHALRMIVGYSNTKLIGASAIGGALFLLFADIIARTLLSPTEIPIGVITAFAGAPFFIFLASRMRRSGILL